MNGTKLKKKRIKKIVFLSIILTILILLSSLFNYFYIKDNKILNSTKYNLINEFDNPYININDIDIENSLKQIGFDVILFDEQEDERIVSGFNYYEEVENSDYVRIKSDENGNLKELNVSILYDSKNVNGKELGENIQNVMGNFVDIKLDTDRIISVINKKVKIIGKDDDFNIECYKTMLEDKRFYYLNVKVTTKDKKS